MKNIKFSQVSKMVGYFFPFLRKINLAVADTTLANIHSFKYVNFTFFTIITKRACNEKSAIYAETRRFMQSMFQSNVDG